MVNIMISHEIDKQTIYSYLEEVKDPEIPVLNVVDLGVVRDVVLRDGDSIEILITPTYSGCPAMDVIAMNIRIMLATLGFKKIKITESLSPAWTTDWITEEGKRKLRDYGIAPPNPKQQVCNDRHFMSAEAVQCPQCDSFHTHRVSEFGSTPCKALYICDDCKEPFDYFKCH
jgi:ring-1,2-phenylacetyl-CoA epoxidase subunit PaaD